MPARKPTSVNFNNPDAVIPWPIWVREHSGLSDREARRQKAEGRGPIITKLSERRDGVTVANHRKWVASRECKIPAAPEVQSEPPKGPHKLRSVDVAQAEAAAS